MLKVKVDVRLNIPLGVRLIYNEFMQTVNILRQIKVVLFLFVLVACNALAEEPLSTDITQTAAKMNIDIPTVTEIANQNWVIVTKEIAEGMGITSLLRESDDFWAPSVSDVLKLEEKIDEYLSQNSNQFYRQPPVWERLDEYQRQYIGFERDGKQIIYGNYFCDSTGKNWRQEFVFVFDGGDCFFQVEYDVESGTFIKLWVNGES